MSQETAAPANLAQTAATGESLAASSAAATNVTSQTAATTIVPPAVLAEKPIKEMGKEEHKNAVVANLEARRAAAAAAAGKPKETPVPPVAEGAEAQPETVADVTSATEQNPEPVAPPSEEDPAAARLLKLARDGQRLAQERKQFREEKARDKAEAEATRAQTAAAQERLARIEKARAGGREVDILRAAGLSDEQIRGPLVINLLDQLKQEEEAAAAGGGKPVQPGLTREQVQEIVAAQQQEQARQAAVVEQQRLQASIEQGRNQRFAEITTEFQTGQYPLVAAVRPTHAEIDTHIIDHYKRTGESLTAVQVLGAFETRYKEQGLTVTPRPKPGQKPPTPATAATTRTIGARATSDGGEILPPAEPKKNRTAQEIREEGKAKALAFLESKRAARG